MRFHIKADYVDVFVMRKAHAEFRNKLASLQFWIYQITQAGEKPTRSIARCNGDVAICTDSGSRPLAREELLPMTIETRRVLGKLRDIRKSRIAFTNFLPIRRWEFMAGITG